MIWGPFVLALMLGLVISAGLYFAYMWPYVEADLEAASEPAPAPPAPAAEVPPSPPPAEAGEPTAGP